MEAARSSGPAQKILKGAAGDPGKKKQTNGQPSVPWFGVPERPMTENEFRNRLTLPWNPPASMRQSQMTPEQIEEVMQPQSHMSQMSPQQIAQIQKRQEMLEHFRRVITARRHAAMNP